MKQCHGAFELFPGVFTQGECGSDTPHDRHNFTTPTSLDEVVMVHGFGNVYAALQQIIDEQEQR